MIKPNELGQPVTEADLLPFVNAQAPVYSQVIEELTAGCKRTHWMWFIFPQLREALGIVPWRSATLFAI